MTRYVEVAPGHYDRIRDQTSAVGASPTQQCIHLKEATGQTVSCPTCPGSTRIKLFKCEVYGECTLVKHVQPFACCNGVVGMGNSLTPCPSFTTERAQPLQNATVRGVKWAYCVTTVPQRRKTLLLRTLESLRAAGFESPRLFVDGDKDALSWEKEFHLEVTCRYPAVRTAGNWVLSLAEMYVRCPDRERYAVFQDDFVTYRNLRAYLERCKYPAEGYWNLYTFPENQKLATGVGWYKSNQKGRGAVATVFSREAVVKLLTHQHMVLRPQDANRGWRAVDGGIVETLSKHCGWREYVHNPSLVQHTGAVSAMQNEAHPRAVSFRGESYDALEILKEVSC